MILTTYKLSDCLRSHGLLVVSRETLRLRVRGQQQEQLAGEEAQAGRQAGGPAASRPPQPPREGGDRVSLDRDPEPARPGAGVLLACPVVVLLWTGSSR
jgi:hypothetical protein